MTLHLRNVENILMSFDMNTPIIQSLKLM